MKVMKDIKNMSDKKFDATQYGLSNLDLKEYLKRKVKYCDTSIEELNKALGGLACGSYYLICAPTNAGKSTLLQSLMIDCLHKGKKCLYITSEDEASAVAVNIILALSNIPLKKYYSNKLTDQNIEYMIRTQEKYQDQIYMYHRTSLVDNLAERIKSFAELGVEYVFYDYIGSIADPNNRKEYASLIAESDDFQSLCSRHDICMIAACQTNGNIYNKEEGKMHEFTANDIAGAKGLANKAKVVIFLFDSRDEEGKSIKMMSIWKAKRWLEQLPDTTFRVAFDPQKVQVRSIDTFEMNKF